MYQYLNSITTPKVIAEAVKLKGITETPGERSTREILSWAEELNIGRVYTNDDIPWCGLFAAIVVKRAGYTPVPNFLRARSWVDFGNGVPEAMLGDILVFTRKGGGHVGFYVGEDKDAYHVLGGNQNNSVNVVRILKKRCIAFRRCPWKIKQPGSVRKIFLSPVGEPSTDES